MRSGMEVDSSFSDGSVQLALRLFQSKSRTSSVVSPFSIALTMGMVNAGAAGKTRRQISESLFKGRSADEINKLAIQYLQELGKLHIGSVLYVEVSRPEAPKGAFPRSLSEELPRKGGFKSNLGENYKIEVKEADFSNSSSNERSRINEEIKQATEGHISDMIPEGSIGTDTTLVIANAIHFSLPFKSVFETNKTRMRTFYNEDNSTKEVPMMHNARQEGRFLSMEKFDYVDFSFQWEDYNVFVIVPKACTLSELIAEFENNVFSLSDVFKQVVSKRYYLDVAIPKFKIEDFYDLRTPLKSMGVVNAFTKQADFAQIADAPLNVDFIMHKAVFDMGEKGVTAAAATVSGFTLFRGYVMAGRASIVADRPFLFGVRHKRLPLFIGQYY